MNATAFKKQQSFQREPCLSDTAHRYTQASRIPQRRRALLNARESWAWVGLNQGRVVSRVVGMCSLQLCSGPAATLAKLSAGRRLHSLASEADVHLKVVIADIIQARSHAIHGKRLVSSQEHC